jgi:Mg2+-importing ATPase
MSPTTGAEAYWSRPAQEVCSALSTLPQGLSSAEAQDRLNQAGRNLLRPQGRIGPVVLFLNQFKSPLVLILIFAAAISVLTGEWIDASIIVAIVVASAVLGFIQEYNAGNAVEKLRSQVTLKTTVLHDGQPRSILDQVDGNESKPCT